MKSLFIIVAIFALSTANTNFLRNLDVTYAAAEYSADCITSATSFTISITDTTAGKDTGDLAATFKKGSDTLTMGACAQDSSVSATTKIDCAAGSFSANAATGNYTLAVTSAKSGTITVTKAASLCYTTNCLTVASSTSKTPSFKYEGDEAANFTITLGAAFTTESAPAVYADSTTLSCTANNEKTTLTCSGTKTTLPGGEDGAAKNYTITLGECKLYTGIVLSVSSGSFFNFSGLLLAILALVLF